MRYRILIVASVAFCAACSQISDSGVGAAVDSIPTDSGDLAQQSDTGPPTDLGLTSDDLGDAEAIPPDAQDMPPDAAAVPTCPGTGLQKSAFFSRRPADRSPDRVHERTLIGLLDCATVGSTVRASIFRINRNAVADAIVRAATRGVDVRLIIDYDNRYDNGQLNPAIQTIRAGLGNRLTICGNANGGSCIGTNINHNKFAVFSALADGSSNVVMQSSSNQTAGQASLHNNSVIVREDAALFGHYVDYWNDLNSEVKNPNYFKRLDGDTNTRIYLSPRATGDTVLNLLGNMDCSGGGQLRVAMSLFNENRPGIAERIVEMRNAGCVVDMVLRGDDEAPDASILQTLRAGNVPFIQYPARLDGWNLHSKYFIWNGVYAGVAARKVVFTGSHNWNLNALRNNDETIFRVDDDAIYDAFEGDFALLKQEAAQ